MIVIVTIHKDLVLSWKKNLVCYDLKLELRLHLGKDLREVKRSCISGKA